MIKEYKTIQEIASPLMIVKNVEGVTYDELAEIELPNGEVRRCKVLEVENDHAVVQLFESAQGINLAQSKVRFLGHPLQLGVSEDMLGRVFNGMGEPIDGGPAILAEVTAAFYQYEEALVSNNIEALDALFWHDPRTVRLGAGENLYGIEAIRAFRAARPAAGLARDLRHTTITTFGADMAVCSTEFTREGSARLGRQQQTWVRFPYGWRIVAAQVSLMD